MGHNDPGPTDHSADSGACVDRPWDARPATGGRVVVPTKADLHYLAGLLGVSRGSDARILSYICSTDSGMAPCVTPSDGILSLACCAKYVRQICKPGDVVVAWRGIAQPGVALYVFVADDVVPFGDYMARWGRPDCIWERAPVGYGNA